MSPEVGIETIALLPEIHPHHHTGSGSPGDGNGIIVLSKILFYLLQNPAPAIGITVTIDETAGGTRIFKLIGAIETQYFWLTDTNGWIIIQQFCHWIQPSGSYFHIGVKKYEIICGNLDKRLIVSVCKAVILMQLQEFYRWKISFNHLLAVVGRSVVGNYDLCVSFRTAYHGRQEPLQETASVPVEKDNGDLFAAIHEDA